MATFPRLGTLARWLDQTEDAAALAVFRWTFGAVMAFEMSQYLLAGWVRTYFMEDRYLLKYAWFEWVHPLPPPAMIAVFWVGFFAALGVAFGALFRLCAILLFLAHTYTFLLSSSHYLNHGYLIVLLTFLMIFVPAHRALAVDSWIRRGLARREIPRWPRMLFIFQIGIVYFFGGIAKINSDWLVYRMPIRRWLASSAKDVSLGSSIIGSEAFSYIVAWGGTAFDLFIIPALLWRKTRAIAVVAAVMFHMLNFHMFDIGVFPWLMLFSTPIFFEATWPRRIPWVGRWIGARVDRGSADVPRSEAHLRRVTLCLIVWAIWQIYMPLRHYLYPGDVAWNEEGHMYSWRMKLRSKSGRAKFRVVDPMTGKVWKIDPNRELTKRQVRKLCGHPEMIRQYAQHLDETYRREHGVDDPQVFGDVFVRLNYRQAERFIDPKFDLSTEWSTVRPFPWVLPFEWTPPPTK